MFNNIQATKLLNQTTAMVKKTTHLEPIVLPKIHLKRLFYTADESIPYPIHADSSAAVGVGSIMMNDTRMNQLISYENVNDDDGHRTIYEQQQQQQQQQYDPPEEYIRTNIIETEPEPESEPMPSPELIQQLFRPSISSQMLDDELVAINRHLIGSHRPSTDGTLEQYVRNLNHQPTHPQLLMDQAAVAVNAPVSQSFSIRSPSRLLTRFIDRMYRSSSSSPPISPDSSSSNTKFVSTPSIFSGIFGNLAPKSPTINSPTSIPTLSYDQPDLFQLYMNQAIHQLTPPPLPPPNTITKPPSRLRQMWMMNRHRFPTFGSERTRFLLSDHPFHHNRYIPTIITHSASENRPTTIEMKQIHDSSVVAAKPRDSIQNPIQDSRSNWNRPIIQNQPKILEYDQSMMSESQNYQYQQPKDQQLNETIETVENNNNNNEADQLLTDFIKQLHSHLHYDTNGQQQQPITAQVFTHHSNDTEEPETNQTIIIRSRAVMELLRTVPLQQQQQVDDTNVVVSNGNVQLIDRQNESPNPPTSMMKSTNKKKKKKTNIDIGNNNNNNDAFTY
ncbi:hypothetical protein BLOT_012950, partial [Blomia tropicalis]